MKCLLEIVNPANEITVVSFDKVTRAIQHIMSSGPSNFTRISDFDGSANPIIYDNGTKVFVHKYHEQKRKDNSQSSPFVEDLLFNYVQRYTALYNAVFSRPVASV